MEKFVIEGSTRLHGDVTISGSKNAAVAIIPATILVKGPVILENVPDISDVRIICDILQEMGAKVEKIDDKKILLTITEWKYHQVKRMLESINNKVTYLKRIRIWNWNLEGLKKGNRKLIELQSTNNITYIKRDIS